MTALQWLRRQRRGLLRAAVSVAVGGVLLFFVLRAIRTADLVETLSDISPGLAVLAAIGAFAFIVARAWRYRLLLGIERSKTGTLLAITFASWGASLVLPGPSGDAAFVLLARTRLKTPVAVGAGPCCWWRPRWPRESRPAFSISRCSPRSSSRFRWCRCGSR